MHLVKTIYNGHHRRWYCVDRLYSCILICHYLIQKLVFPPLFPHERFVLSRNETWPTFIPNYYLLRIKVI